MQIHNLVQGSPEWHQFRLEHFGASEAAAMLGLSSKVSRTELLHMKHTCTAKEFSDWVQINILDYGHEVEAMARPQGEEIIGTELYPVTCSDGRLSASCDGLTMAEDDGWEHKQWNEALAVSVAEGVLPDEHQPQPQQQLMVTGAKRWLFMVSDGTPERMVYMWVYPDAEWQERIRQGWAQFAADLAVYEPKNFTPKPPADPIMALPALSIQIRGEVTVSNLPVFKAKADRFIASIKTDLLTDEDFANAEATIKFCDSAEKHLELAKASAIAQTASIDELMRTVDHISDQLREKRLLLTRTVKDKKELLKASILSKVKQDFADHVAELEKEIAPLRLVFQARDFAGAMKNKRTLATLHDAVDTELANGKITVDAIAKAVRGRLTWYKAAVIDSDFAATDYSFLFADLQNLIQKPDDDFKLVVTSRIDAHKSAEAEKARVALARAQAEATARSAATTPVTLHPVSSQPAVASVVLSDPGFVEVRTQPATPPTLRLGQIADRLGFALTADFLRTLGFGPAGKDRAAVLYHESDFPAMCAALIRHIGMAQAKQAA
jgi:predicted phage-related endonuclease